jgi:lysophospholipase L1-like esterase
MSTGLVRCKLVFSTLALVACAALTGGGCGDSGGGTGTGGTGGSAGGATGTAGDSGRGGTGGETGIAGTSGPAGTTGSGGASGGSGAGGATAGAGGSAGSGGAVGRGGTGGSAGGGGGTGGGAGRGGASGNAGTGGAGTGGGPAGTGGGGGGAGGRITNPRIMPLGDSTTASVCYRAQLWQMLTQSGRTQFQFIGSRNGDPGCGVSGYDRDNEGHGGYIVTDILKAAGTGTRPGGADSSDLFASDARDLATWFDGRPADIVLMHFGTNDVWNNFTPTNILNAYTAILNKLRAVNPNVRVLVAQIIPLQPSGCNDCPTRAQSLNAQIPTWAAANSTAASPISVVDQYTGFNPATGQDTSDGVHPNAAGSTKIAAKWFAALTPLF